MTQCPLLKPPLRQAQFRAPSFHFPWFHPDNKFACAVLCPVACEMLPNAHVLCRLEDAGGPQKKNSWYHRGIFFQGVPPEGEGGTKKNLRKNFSRPKKLKFFDFYCTFLNVEGARRIPFKVFIHILADMGGICV